MKLLRSTMNVSSQSAWLPSLALGLAVLVTPVNVNANAGKILFALGDVNVDREELLPAKRGMSVLEGDMIITGAKGRAQLKMNDGGKVSVRPSSEFKIETFTMGEPIVVEEPSNTQSLGRVTDDGDTAVYKLLKGGFRTVTGVVGKRDGDTYKVETPVATIGIRGTDFTVVLCESNCADQPGANGSDSGVFVGVSSGHVVLGNNLGEINLFANETGFVGFGKRPVILEVPAPPVFEDLPAPPAEEEQDEEAETESETAAAQPTTAERLAQRRSPSPTEQDTAPPAEQTAETPVVAESSQGEVDLTSGETIRSDDQISLAYVLPISETQSLTEVTRQFPEQFAVDSSGNLIEFEGVGTSGETAEETEVYTIGNAEQLNTGMDPLTSLRWGRWAFPEFDSGSTGADSASSSSFGSSVHWIISPGFAEAIVPTEGTATYTLVGNTDPTDLQGNVGSLGSANFSANFSNATVSSEVRLTMQGELWVANGTGDIGFDAPNHFDGVYDTVTRSAQTADASGTFTGFFAPVSDTTNPIPQGAGLIYNLHDGLGATDISGAAVFGNPN